MTHDEYLRIRQRLGDKSIAWSLGFCAGLEFARNQLNGHAGIHIDINPYQKQIDALIASHLEDSQ